MITSDVLYSKYFFRLPKESKKKQKVSVKSLNNKKKDKEELKTIDLYIKGSETYQRFDFFLLVISDIIFFLVILL